MNLVNSSRQFSQCGIHIGLRAMSGSSFRMNCVCCRLQDELPLNCLNQAAPLHLQALKHHLGRKERHGLCDTLTLWCFCAVDDAFADDALKRLAGHAIWTISQLLLLKAEAVES